MKIFDNRQTSNAMSGCDFILLPFPKRNQTVCVRLWLCLPCASTFENS